MAHTPAATVAKPQLASLAHSLLTGRQTQRVMVRMEQQNKLMVSMLGEAQGKLERSQEKNAALFYLMTSEMERRILEHTADGQGQVPTDDVVCGLLAIAGDIRQELVEAAGDVQAVLQQLASGAKGGVR